MKENPTFYAVLPANIRYAEDLSSLQKLLYAEITCLTDKMGYCFATNSYFENLYHKDKIRVSKQIVDMEKK
jgi:hypothetical protein